MTITQNSPSAVSIFAHGFLIPAGLLQPPPSILPAQYAPWEDALAEAQGLPLQLHDVSRAAHNWRTNIRAMPVLPTAPLLCDVGLRLRARHVLIYLLHFFVHSLGEGPDSPHVPASIAIPLLIISDKLDLPPVLTYADTEYYNFAWAEPGTLVSGNEPRSMKILTTFSGTGDEDHFLLTSLKIEEEGVRALHVMSQALDVLHRDQLGTKPSADSMADLFRRLASHVRIMDRILEAVCEGCDPAPYYALVRPWFVGCPEDERSAWVFDVKGQLDELEEMTLSKAVEGSQWVRTGGRGEITMGKMAGASAAQSSIIQALDAFLGIDDKTHGKSTGEEAERKDRFLAEMRCYLPREHRGFLRELGVQATGLREWVLGASVAEGEVTAAYNDAVNALRRFRTTHLGVATLYIVKQRSHEESEADEQGVDAVKGTGGTSLVSFLKGVRDRTANATLSAI
ncbi:Indoleamine 2,3-dioxygenase [Amylostereum chailletii]|nr:Indoleamine 2,3-dioxygenase [Amylostereum chailletii]